MAIQSSTGLLRIKTLVLDPVDAFWKIGVNDKTCDPDARKVAVASVQNQSFRAPVLPGMSIEAANHSGCFEKLVLSVIQFMNNSPDPEDSLFSGGSKLNWRTFVSIHDVTLDPSSNMLYFYLFVLMNFFLVSILMQY